LLSNILLTPFDQEMRRKGYQLTRYADDWVITCKSAVEARAALADALRILERLGVHLNPEKTRIVQCAPTGQITSGGRTHSSSCW
jgi:retron-type reverse transcriptase